MLAFVLPYQGRPPATLRRAGSWFLALALCVLAATDLAAWEVRDVLVPEKEGLLRNPSFDILAVTVLAVEDAGATNGSPPTVDVRVEEVLRGGSRPEILEVRWQAPIFHEDWNPAGGGTTEAWRELPLAGPDVGARLVVFAIGPPEGVAIQAWAVYRFTPETRDAVLEHAFMAHRGAVLWGLLAAPLVLGLLSLILLLRSFSKRIEDRARRRLRLAVIGTGLASLGFYVVYESGVSPYAAIRIDLLILWPAVGFSLVLAIVSLIILLFGLRRGRPAD